MQDNVPNKSSWLASVGTVVASLIAGYLGGVASTPPAVSPDAAHRFYRIYYAELVHDDSREKARMRLSEGLQSLGDNSRENFDAFWKEYVSAEVTTLIPTGVKNTFLINSVYAKSTGNEWRRTFQATLSCGHPLSRFALVDCPVDDIRLEAAMTVVP